MTKPPPADKPGNVVALRPGQIPPAALTADEALEHIRTLVKGLSYACGEEVVDMHLDMIRVVIGKAQK